MTVYIYARPEQTTQEAWADSEGLYVCEAHLDCAESPSHPYRLVPVYPNLERQVKAQGQCEVCWENWADGLRRSAEAEARACLDARSHRH